MMRWMSGIKLLTLYAWIGSLRERYRWWRYVRASRTCSDLRGMLMYEWAQATDDQLPEEERERIRAAQRRSRDD